MGRPARFSVATERRAHAPKSHGDMHNTGFPSTRERRCGAEETVCALLACRHDGDRGKRIRSLAAGSKRSRQRVWRISMENRKRLQYDKSGCIIITTGRDSPVKHFPFKCKRAFEHALTFRNGQPCLTR